MAVHSTLEITQLLVAWNNGDQAALERLTPLVHTELRFFAGLSLEETAEALRVSLSIVRRDWSLAEAWLYRELSKTMMSDE